MIAKLNITRVSQTRSRQLVKIQLKMASGVFDVFVCLCFCFVLFFGPIAKLVGNIHAAKYTCREIYMPVPFWRSKGCLPFVRINRLGRTLNNGKGFSKISKPTE